MKKLITLGLGLLLITSANAQWWGGKKITGNGNIVKKDRKVGEYDEVSVAGFMDVDLVAGKEGTITISADENLMEYIETEVKNGDLKIYIERGKNIKPSKGNKVLITVPFEDINAVSLAGSGDVNTKDVINADDFDVSLAGSGDVNLEINANEVESKLAGSGDIRLTGKSGSHMCRVAGSGDIHAYDLIAENVEATIAGSGDIKVHCTSKLKARVSGSGDIRYKGSPNKEDSKVAGSGSVSKM